MIAVDTNILVRLLADGDSEQHSAARAFFSDRLSAATPGFVSLIVIVETCWVLTSIYKFKPEVVGEAILAVIDCAQIVVEQPEIARAALAGGLADIADRLIHLVGAAAGCTATVTFDRRFARQTGVELLA